MVILLHIIGFLVVYYSLFALGGLCMNHCEKWWSLPTWILIVFVGVIGAIVYFSWAINLFFNKLV